MLAHTRNSDFSPIQAKGMLTLYLRTLISTHKNKFYTRIYASLIFSILGSGIGVASLFDTVYSTWIGPSLIITGIILWAKSKPPYPTTFFQTLFAKLPGLKLKSFDIVDSTGKGNHIAITSKEGILMRSPLILDMNTGDISVSAYNPPPVCVVGVNNANTPLPVDFAPGTSLLITRNYAGFPTGAILSIIGGEVHLIVTAQGTAEKSEYLAAAEAQWKKMLTPQVVEYLMDRGIFGIWGQCMSKCDQTHGTRVEKDFILITAAGKRVTGGDIHPTQVDVFGLMSRAGLGKYCEAPLVLRGSVSKFVGFIQSNRDVMTEHLFQNCLESVGLSRKSRYNRVLGNCLGRINITIVPPNRILGARRSIFTILAAGIGAMSGAFAWRIPASVSALALTAIGANACISALAKIYEEPTQTITVKFVNYTSRTVGLRDKSAKCGVLSPLGITISDHWHMSKGLAAHIERFVQTWVHEESARGHWRARMILMAQLYDEALAKFETKSRAQTTRIAWPWITAADKVDRMINSGRVITPMTAEELRAQAAQG